MALRVVSKTLIVVVLDESGSMSPKLTDTLGGFNQFMTSQRQVPNDQGYVYLVTFNSTVKVLYKGVPLDDIPALTGDNYKPSGYTALYDAIGRGVGVALEDKGAEDRVICVIMTDGEENASKHTTLAQVREVIAECEGKGDWTFVYIGENPEQWSRSTGMSHGSSTRYNHHNSEDNYSSANSAVTRLRTSVQKSIKNIFLPD
ncbi:unnamed protein product [Oppiella nova]|uniref:VWFA domain-containing protein n=1 Tax=Oppiella nova TaxID=334625 RepID=A0A7R9LPJ5_9ACAR|nr:unnamed protein product [Oppiella nova]CAG2164990.1 unnamed protein product [Oppiella nova]